MYNGLLVSDMSLLKGIKTNNLDCVKYLEYNENHFGFGFMFDEYSILTPKRPANIAI